MQSVSNTAADNKVNKVPIEQSPLMTLEGEAYSIPPEGSLGLLAMGYVGVQLWREKRETTKNNNNNEKSKA